jgi:predicted RNase H-like nuclease (RuvC/YqgF family)
MYKIQATSTTDVSSVLRALKLSQLQQVGTHQKVRRIKEQLFNAATTVRLISQLQSYDASIIEDLTKDLRESRQSESHLRRKCEEVSKEMECLRAEVEAMKVNVAQLQKELELARNDHGEMTVTVLSDKEVDAMLARRQITSSIPRQRSTASAFESWRIGEFVNAYQILENGSPVSPSMQTSQLYKDEFIHDDRFVSTEGDREYVFVNSKTLTASPVQGRPRSMATSRRGPSAVEETGLSRSQTSSSSSINNKSSQSRLHASRKSALPYLNSR